MHFKALSLKQSHRRRGHPMFDKLIQPVAQVAQVFGQGFNDASRVRSYHLDEIRPA